MGISGPINSNCVHAWGGINGPISAHWCQSVPMRAASACVVHRGQRTHRRAQAARMGGVSGRANCAWKTCACTHGVVKHMKVQLDGRRHAAPMLQGIPSAHPPHLVGPHPALMQLQQHRLPAALQRHHALGEGLGPRREDRECSAGLEQWEDLRGDEGGGWQGPSLRNEPRTRQSAEQAVRAGGDIS